MAYSDDAVRAKLASLNETQDSIVANAQWIMFHRRHADQTAALWLERLLASSTPKRLNLLYLANEVVQQSRARGKPDFLLAFEPMVADATAAAYKGAAADVQAKVRRVVEVWRQRSIFDVRILENVEARLLELEKARGGGGGGGKAKLGGSLFGGGGVPAELEAVSKSAAAVVKADAEVSTGAATQNAASEYAKMTDPDTPLPTPPVHAARLSALLRNLAAAQAAVEASITARKGLLSGLQELVSANQAKLAQDEANAAELTTRRDRIELRKREVEDGIMRGLSAPTSPSVGASTPNTATPTAQINGTVGDNVSATPIVHDDITAPEAEGFTPPPPDADTSPSPQPLEQDSHQGGDSSLSMGSATTIGHDGKPLTSDLQTLLADAESLMNGPSNLAPPPPIPPTTNETDVRADHSTLNSASSSTTPATVSAAEAANAFLSSLELPAATSIVGTGTGNSNPLRRQASSSPLPPFTNTTDHIHSSTSTNGHVHSQQQHQQPGDPRLKRRKTSHAPSGSAAHAAHGGLGAEGVFAGSTGAKGMEGELEGGVLLGEVGVDEEGIAALLGP